MKKITILFLLLFGFQAQAQLKETSFENLDSLTRKSPRNIVVFIHTDWCRYCQKMKHTTFKDSTIIQKLNTDIYWVSLNAEDKKSIYFNQHLFIYKPTGTDTGVHELAVALATINEKVSYPSICILNPQYEIIYQYDQFMDARDLQVVLDRYVLSPIIQN